jgi:hypothetical protein
VITKRAARWSKLALLAAGVFAFAGAATSPSYAANDTEIFFVQGVPGQDLDAAIDEAPRAQGIKPAAPAGPYLVTPGSHTVTFSENGKTVLTKSFMIKAGSTLDLVAHLLASSSSGPTVAVYDKYDGVTVTKGKALFVVTHVAAAQPLDIRVNNKVLFRNIANGESLQRRVPGGPYTISIVPTGKREPVYYGPVSLTIKSGQVAHIYVEGDQNQKTMNITPRFVSAATTGTEPPNDVDTGTGGQALGYGPMLVVNLAR